MKPSDLSNQLRSIASKLDRSKNPSKTLVASELKRLVAAVSKSSSSVIVSVWYQDTFSPSELDQTLVNKAVVEAFSICGGSAYVAPMYNGFTFTNVNPKKISDETVEVTDIEVSDNNNKMRKTINRNSYYDDIHHDLTSRLYSSAEKFLDSAEFISYFTQ